ncbi:TetR/AcrR family transcriptional regulator [Variovorax sp. YR216]|uniref:TetR/AcrR family transcriptional regulator n=1 Tax=Variovorax sp. YR216 TaxID=1882828 RepID=UPI0008974162|nr:TetR/AcrR family transcriptional regulator [Variovorax sp. YR216]SEB25968.1 transcriptional regulator, TetR family [Variovorax sp. YR216]
MSFRHPKNEVLSRARTPEDKAKVREAFIAAGRKLFAEEEDHSRISLRRIAAEAGYAPGAIYQYFAHQQDLFVQIRAHDMHAATQDLRHLIARTRDPARRVEKLFIGAAEYWLGHMDEFLMIFPAASTQPAPVPAGTQPFGQSSVVMESLDLYYETVEGLWATLSSPPMPARLAADMLIAAVHGTIVFPCMTRTMEWSDTRLMVTKLVTTIVRQWTSHKD